MTGRVKRRAGLAAAVAQTERKARRAAEGDAACPLCDRPLGVRVEWHHVVPRSEGGTRTVAVHPICHRAIHAAFSNAALAQAGGISGIRDHPAIARFRAFVARKPADFHAPTRTGRAWV